MPLNRQPCFHPTPNPLPKKLERGLKPALKWVSPPLSPRSGDKGSGGIGVI